MTFSATKIATGASLIGAGGVAGVLLAPQQADSNQRATVTQAAPPPVVRTIHIKRVHHRTIREKPKPVHNSVRAAAPAPVVRAAAPVRYVAAAPPPAAVRHPLRTRTSGSGGHGGEHEHEGGGGDD